MVNKNNDEDTDVSIYTSQSETVASASLSLSLDEIERLAEVAHFGQVDKLGVDYIEHPRAVAKLVESVPSYKDLTLGEQWQAVAAAFLHDVIEDTPMTSANLYNLGLPIDVLYVIRDLTRKQGVSSENYYNQILNSNRSRVVKIADMAHNADYDRLSQLDASTADRLRGKYGKGIKILTAKHQLDLEWFLKQTRLELN